MLTAQKLKDLPPGVFASGSTTDDENGANIWTTGEELQWVAVRGSGYHDWAIYLRGSWNADSVPNSPHFIASIGDKLSTKRFVRNIIDCDDEALALYRDR